jgi:hypothetical protein
LVGFGFDACILSDAADQPPLILTTQGTLPFTQQQEKAMLESLANGEGEMHRISEGSVVADARFLKAER